MWHQGVRILILTSYYATVFVIMEARQTDSFTLSLWATFAVAWSKRGGEDGGGRVGLDGSKSKDGNTFVLTAAIQWTFLETTVYLNFF